MSPMSDQPLTLVVLAEFHHQVFLPDMERLVGESERRLRDVMYGLHDVVIQRLDRLVDEFQALNASLERVEGRLDLHEASYQDLIAAVHRLEERLGRVEKRLDDIADAQERFALRSEVTELRARLESLEARLQRRSQGLDE